MYLSVNQEPMPAINPAPDITKSEAWELVSIGLGVLDSSLQIKFCNPFLQTLLASPRQELTGKNFLQVLDINNQLRAHISSELTMHQRWQGIIHNANHALRIEITRSDSRATDGSARNELIYPVVIIDYSADYKKLKELSTAKSLAEKTDKAKSRFLSQMSHELRTPLNAILGFTQLMNIAPDLSDQQHDNLQEIESAGNYLLTLINEILDLSKIESGKIKLSEETVSLEQLLAECLTLVKPVAEKRNIRLECVLTTEKQLHTDPVRLKQVMLNLLANAIKYNTENGLVVVYCHDVDDNSIRIEIQDSGPGIAPQLLSKIFSPFERIGVKDKNIAGSGLGLMIARRLMRLMGGKIDVLSEPLYGSVFWLELPAVSLDAMEFQYFQEVAISRVAFAAESNKVIYVGENADFAALLQRLLSLRENIQLQTFTDFAEARAGFTSRSKACVFVSEKIACDLAQDGNSIYLPWNPGWIVVKDKNLSEMNPSYTQMVKAQLPDSFKLTDIFKLIDKSFLDKF